MDHLLARAAVGDAEGDVAVGSPGRPLRQRLEEVGRRTLTLDKLIAELSD